MADLPAKAFVLMAMMRLRFGGMTLREPLRTLLWEDANPTRARDSVRRLIAEIRSWQEHNGVALIATDGQAITLVAPSDLDILLEAKAPVTAADVRALEAACGGPFLEGIGGGFGRQLLADLADWRTEVRRRYVALILPAASKMGGEDGERILRDLYDSEPDNEVLLRPLLQHLANGRGERAARDLYETFLARLETDGRRPTLETQALYAQIVPSPVAAAPRTAVDRTGGPGGIPRIVMLTPPPIGVPQRAAGLAAALIEDVTLRLCSQRTFAMLAPHTARQIEGADAVAAAAPVDVDYVAVSRLVPDASGPVLNVALIRADNRQIVVSRRFDFVEEELETRFSELAYMIASQLNRGIETVEIKSYRNTGAASAYVHFLKWDPLESTCRHASLSIL